MPNLLLCLSLPLSRICCIIIHKKGRSSNTCRAASKQHPPPLQWFLRRSKFCQERHARSERGARGEFVLITQSLSLSLYARMLGSPCLHLESEGVQGHSLPTWPSDGGLNDLLALSVRRRPTDRPCRVTYLYLLFL